uniref:hypothetical protein n=1 Tax=Parerythrobacter lutipelagi TaxID=1964208 RepID=UPI0010F8386B|nr:hypothetical protein [Parerythrobacter lutipelagi]
MSMCKRAISAKTTMGLLTAVGGLALAGCATRPPPPPPPPPPMAEMPPPQAPQMQVVRGSADAVRWYPIGRIVPVSGRICFPTNVRFITFERLDGGGLITYGGEGCNQRVSAPPKGPDEEDGVWKGP